MSAFKVNPSVLKSKANELNSLNGRFKTAVGQLVSSEGSLKSMWEGEANEAFHQAFTTDKVKMDQFYNLIIQYIGALNTISEKYQQTEASNTEIARQRKY